MCCIYAIGKTIRSEIGPNKHTIALQRNVVQNMVEKLRKNLLPTAFNPFGKAEKTFPGKTMQDGNQPLIKQFFKLKSPTKITSITIGAKIKNVSLVIATPIIKYSRKNISKITGIEIKVLKIE